MSRKRSNYNLGMSFMYLRLSLQSMSKPNEQEAVWDLIAELADLPPVEKLRTLAKMVAAKTQGMEEVKRE